VAAALAQRADHWQSLCVSAALCIYFRCLLTAAPYAFTLYFPHTQEQDWVSDLQSGAALTQIALGESPIDDIHDDDTAAVKFVVVNHFDRAFTCCQNL
jgi:hypothetical protein